jgi:predicted  nucleic acid-binding Zn-ribbon protein
MTAAELSPAEQITRDISSLQSDIKSLQSDVQLSDLRDDLDKLESKTSRLAGRIAGLRGRGYVFEKNLEPSCADLPARWAKITAEVIVQIDLQSRDLKNRMFAVENQMSRITSSASNPAAARPLITTLKMDIENLENKASAAESAIKNMYNDFSGEVDKLDDHIEKLEWMLTQSDEASFKLMPTEAMIMAVKAEWAKDGKDAKTNPEGILFLTDQRLIFEQKQEIATKKFLFITTETEKVQTLLFEIPVPMIEKVEVSKQGFFKNEDWVELVFATGAQLREAIIHLDGQDCAVWQGLLNKAVAKEFDRDRVTAVSQAEVEKVKKAPTICPSCGGAITKPVLRGMDSINCEFCGKVIRL